MKRYLLLIIIALISIAVLFYINKGRLLNKNNPLLTPLSNLKPKEKLLLAYTFENLKKTTFPPSQIILGRMIKENSDFITQMFYFSVPEKPKSSNLEKVSGVINVPKSPGTYPLIIMFRGYQDEDTYQQGNGTQPFANKLAEQGFITLAPDFLGFGESASPSANPFEGRFQTYSTALTLLSSIQNLNTGLEASYSGKIKADLSKIGLWGHSNGGHISLSTLAISGVSYPTVLWAPVSRTFPYSILYYTDDTDDHGKAMRKMLARFEADYDIEQFSPPNYYRWIKAPLLINQGANDKDVPIWWSDDLVASLKKVDIEVTYLTYPGADHNLRPDAWATAVENSIAFYREHFE